MKFTLEVIKECMGTPSKFKCAFKGCKSKINKEKYNVRGFDLHSGCKSKLYKNLAKERGGIIKKNSIKKIKNVPILKKPAPPLLFIPKFNRIPLILPKNQIINDSLNEASKKE